MHDAKAVLEYDMYDGLVYSQSKLLALLRKSHTIPNTEVIPFVFHYFLAFATGLLQHSLPSHFLLPVTDALTLACSRSESTTNLSTRDGFVGNGGRLRVLSLETDLPGFCLASSASV